MSIVELTFAVAETAPPAREIAPHEMVAAHPVLPGHAALLARQNATVTGPAAVVPEGRHCVPGSAAAIAAINRSDTSQAGGVDPHFPPEQDRPVWQVFPGVQQDWPAAPQEVVHDPGCGTQTMEPSKGSAMNSTQIPSNVARAMVAEHAAPALLPLQARSSGMDDLAAPLPEPESSDEPR
jgi:hypothetical protein